MANHGHQESEPMERDLALLDLSEHCGMVNDQDRKHDKTSPR